MSALKHMETIFAVVVVAGVVVAALPDVAAGYAAGVVAAAPPMPVVVVKAKRMTAVEKRQSLEVDAAIHGAAKGT